LSVAPISCGKQLIVEGEDDRRFIEQFLRARGATEVQVQPIGGKSQLRAYLRTLRNDPGFPTVTSIAVLRDADDDADAAWSAIVNALSTAGFAAPGAPGAFAAGPPRVGALVLPGGARQGSLESLCLSSLPEAELECVDRLLNCFSGLGVPRPKQTDKARAHAWLATRERPGLRVGEAGEKGYWAFSSSAFDELWEFLSGI
jgi:hypothetical protein